MFYETPVESTWGAHRPELINSVNSQLVSVNVSTLARTNVTSSAGFKVFPQYLDNATIAYHVKGGSGEGIYTTAGVARPTGNTWAAFAVLLGRRQQDRVRKGHVQPGPRQRYAAVQLRPELDLQVHGRVPATFEGPAKTGVHGKGGEFVDR
ncbi:hypothetical protein [Massilia phosphatilytica]